jgi:hypothetical protein
MDDEDDLHIKPMQNAPDDNNISVNINDINSEADLPRVQGKPKHEIKRIVMSTHKPISDSPKGTRSRRKIE